MVRALKATKGLIYLAAKKVGCKPDTISERAAVSPAVASCIRQQRGEFVDTAEQKLRAAVNKGERWAIRLTLLTLGKDRGYFERLETKDAPSDDDIEQAIEAELAAVARDGQAPGSGRHPPAPPA